MTVKRRMFGPHKRAVTLDSVEMRDADSGAVTFVGHAAVFNSPTQIGSGRYAFWEQVAPGAFRKTIKDADVRFLFNHDPNYPLARNKAGTLRLSEDDNGLLVEADLDPSDPDAARVIGKMRAGLLDQMSFAFEPLDEKVDTADDGREIRTLTEVKLWDVSVVTYPAYEDTDAALRSSSAFDVLCRLADFDDEARDRFIAKLLSPASEETPEPSNDTRDDSQPDSSTGAPRELLKLRHQALATKHRLT